MIDILFNLIKAFWILPLIILVGWYFKRPSTKGCIGEFITNSVISLKLDSNTYHLIKDLTIETTRGTSQMDEVIVSPYGIFIIETKAWNGWIYGSEKDKEWTVVYGKGGKKYRNENPLRQNYDHMKAFAQKFDIPESKIFSVVVFNGDVDKCQIKTPMPPNVGHPSTLQKFIKSKSEQLFSEADTLKILEQINLKRLKLGAETDRRHIDYVRSLKK